MLALCGIVALSACEKVVELDVENEDPVLIINSQISNVFEKWKVHLSLTQGYFNQSDITHVFDAEVVITDNHGVSDTLVYEADGLYVAQTPKACKVGDSYTLSVRYKNDYYTATETCYYQDTIQLLQSFYLPERNGFIPEGYYVFEKADENEPEGDFYMWRVYKNDTNLIDEIGYQIDDDEFREQGYFNLNIDPDDPLKDLDKGIQPRPFPYSFEKGDRVRVEQLRINEGYYDFISGFATQQQRAGTPFDPPPSNPRSNITGGGYGYFSVVNITAKEVLVTD